jgi:predicted nucleotidyltransferase
MRTELELHYNKFLDFAKRSPYVIGIILAGSRGKGKVTKHSDYDIFVITKNKTPKSIKKQILHFKQNDFEIFIKPFSQFKKYAAWGGGWVWDRYNFTWLKANLDKTGKIQKIINEKGVIPKIHIKPFIQSNLDHYINQVYRSIKCHRDGDLLASRLEANESISPLLNAVFALHGRLRPYYKYLLWELKKKPLNKLPISGKDFILLVKKIAETGDIKTQQKLLKTMGSTFTKNGHYHSWAEKFDWLINY